MTQSFNCPKCGNELPLNAPKGLCPKCLLIVGVEGDDSSTSAGFAETRHKDSDVAGTSKATHTGVVEAEGRYTNIREFGKGGMGRVFLVHDEHLDRDVALKELLPESGFVDEDTPTPVKHSKDMVARFLREAKITGQLEHPSITPVHELGRRKDGTLYYTMKMVRGNSLSDAIKAAKRFEDRQKLLPHFVDLCHAIAYAHSRGVLHRDIKPSNVMVGDYGETVVIDWGLAKVKRKKEGSQADPAQQTLLNRRPHGSVGDSEAGRTAYGSALGTPAYMPPEQARGELDRIDERSDTYSLGAVLYEILTGRPPFSGGAVSEIVEKVIEESPESVRSVEPKVPPELAAICMRAMSKERRNRYQTAEELAQEILNYQSDDFVSAYRYGMLDKVNRYVRQHRGVFATGLAAAAIIALATGVFIWRITQANEDLAIARDAETAQRIEAESQREEAQAAQLESVAAHEEEARARRAEAEARAEAEEKVVELTRASYVSAIRLAENHVAKGERNLALQRLLEAPAEHRHWEWGNLYQALDRSKMTLRGHENLVSSASYSPDGRRIVTASHDQTAKVWDAQTGEQLLTLRGHENLVSSASYSPDGRRIVTASHDRTAKVWDAQTGEELRTLTGHGYEGYVYSASYSPDGRRIVTASRDRTAIVWDAETGEALRTLTIYGKMTGETRVSSRMASAWFTSASYSPDGSRIVTASREGLWNGIAKVWDAQTGEQLLTLSGHDFLLSSASYSPDGRRIVTASRDRTAKVWDARTGKELSTLMGHGDSLFSASYSPDGRRIVTASSDRTAKVWDAETGDELQTLRGHGDSLVSASYSPDGRHIVTASRDYRAKVWDADTSVEQHTLRGHRGPVYSASYSPDGRHIVSTSFDRTAKVWDAATGEELQSFAADPGKLLASASFSPDGRRIVIASRGAFNGPDDVTAKVWDVETREVLLVLPRLGTRRKEAQARVHGVFNSASYSPDGRRILTTSQDNTARVWDAETGKQLRTLVGHESVVFSASYSPDGRRIVTASEDYNAGAKVWDAETGGELQTLKTQGIVNSASFSPGGRRIVTAGERNTAKVWDAETGEELLTLTGHGAWLFSASYSPDGRRIVTASNDDTVKVWDAETGEELRSLTGHEDPFPSASFSPDGRQIVSASGDGTVKVWDAAPWRSDAWADEEMRGRLLRLVLRDRPTSIIMRRYQKGIPQRATQLNALTDMFSRWSAMGDDVATTGFREIPGQGILLEDRNALRAIDVFSLPTLAGISLQESDLIVRINSIPVDTLQEAARIGQSAVRQYREDPSSGVLRIEIVNAFERKVFVF